MRRKALVVAAITAVALSYGNAEFSWIAALAALVGVMFLHLGMNLLDDYFDYKVGSAEARKEVVGEGVRGRMVQYPYLTSGEAKAKQLLVAVFAFLGIAAVMAQIRESFCASSIRVLPKEPEKFVRIRL